MRPADRRRDAKRREEVVGRAAAGDLERLVAVGDQRHHPARRDRRDLLEAARALAPVADLFVRHERARPERDQPIGLLVGQRLQQHAAHDAEDRRVGAGGQRQQQDGGGGKERAMEEIAKGEGEVMGAHGPLDGSTGAGRLQAGASRCGSPSSRSRSSARRLAALAAAGGSRARLAPRDGAVLRRGPLTCERPSDADRTARRQAACSADPTSAEAATPRRGAAAEPTASL